MIDINVDRKVYSLRALELATGEFYSATKIQTLHQNTFFTFAAPRPLIHARGGTLGSISFATSAYLKTGTGILTLKAGGEDSVAGTWNVTVNGTNVTGITVNPWVIQPGDTAFTFTSGYNLITGTFTRDSGSSAFSVNGFWMNSWEL